jgi:hypothetical protein
MTHSSYSFDLGTRWGMNGQRNAPDALYPGKGPPVPIWQEGGWVSELVWTQTLEDKSFTLPGIEPRSSRLYSDTILTELPQLQCNISTVLHCVLHMECTLLFCVPFPWRTHYHWGHWQWIEALAETSMNSYVVYLFGFEMLCRTIWQGYCDRMNDKLEGMREKTVTVYSEVLCGKPLKY